MNEFLRNYIMTIINKMIDGNKEDDYKIMNYALGWYEKNVLTQADLEEIQQKLIDRATVVENPAEVVEEVTEEILEEEVEE